MAEPLSSLDVVNKAFKKTMRGYDPAEVDEFLDLVAESIQSYVQRLKEVERVADEQLEKLGEYESIKNSLQETLLTAQRAAEDKLANATRASEEKIREAGTRADDIVAEAKLSAEKIRRESEAKIADLAASIEKMNELKASAIDSIKGFVRDVDDAIEMARSGGDFQIPDFAREIVRARDAEIASDRAVLVEHHQAAFITSAAEPAEDADDAHAAVSETLNALGIDPSLLNSDI